MLGLVDNTSEHIYTANLKKVVLQKSQTVKFPCDEKIISPIYILVKHYLEISLHGVLGFQ
jgi:hypothetical protein